MNWKTRNKECQINKVYLIYASCVVLTSLQAGLSRRARKMRKMSSQERPLLAGNRLLLRFVKLRVAFVYVSTFVFRLTNVYLLATINPLCIFQCLLPFCHFLECSFQFGSGICKDFQAVLTSLPKACGHFSSLACEAGPRSGQWHCSV